MKCKFLKFKSYKENNFINLIIYFFSLAQVVKGMLAFAIYITHGLACYVAIDITWNDYMKKNFAESPRKLLWEYVTRTLLVLVTCKF